MFVRNSGQNGLWGKTEAKDSLTARAMARARRFSGDEEGSLLIFSMFILILMILVGGMAVDLMRFETRRTALQNTIDSAVLAAADLDQTLDPELVVRDFVEKSGFDPDDLNIVVTEDKVGGVDLVGRSVNATTELAVNTLFMDMLGIYKLKTPASSNAVENVQNVEISLVVDISGSMGGAKLTNLKTAAEEFFNTVVDPERTSGITSISIVPYNANVVVPDMLLDQLNTDGTILIDPSDQHWHPGGLTAYPRVSSESKCVRFYDDDDESSDNISAFHENTMTTDDLGADYQTLRAITPTQELDRLTYFDESSKSDTETWNPAWEWIQPSSGSYARPDNDSNRFCDPSRQEILVHETDPQVMIDHVNAMSAGGWTSIDVGMKWGVALLDPAMRPVINNLVASDDLPDAVENRPDDYIGTQTMKVIVLMTDGANTLQKDMRQAYKNGPSRIWYSEDAAQASGNWYDGYFIEVSENSDSTYWFQPRIFSDRYDGVYYHKTSSSLPADLQQLDYVTLYNRFSEYAVRDIFRDNYNSSGVHQFDDDDIDDMYQAHRYAVYQVEEYGTLDERLNGDADGDGTDTVFGICDAAKVNNDILVFTIAFEAPSAGEAAMQSCATVPGFYYDVAGTDITEAFQSIAGQITTLRLTQ